MTSSRQHATSSTITTPAPRKEPGSAGAGATTMTGPRGGATAVTAAVLVTVLTSMPVFLLGALATEITTTVHVPTFGIGVAVGTYWVAAAVASAGTGLISRVLSERGMGVVALALAVLSLTGTAGWVPAWPWLMVWAGLGGASNGLGHPSSNHLLATRIPASSRAVAFGVKQAAVPLAGLVAGVSIPLVALTLGWPWAFVIMSAIGVLTLIPTALIGSASTPGGRARSRGQIDRHLRSSLLLLAAMTMCAAGAANSAVAFCVTGALDRGLAPGPAGVLLAIGSAAGAVTRIVGGRIVDTGRIPALPLIRAAIIACALGLAVMAIPATWTYVVGFLLAAGLGWG
jgi:MFS family permease